MIIIVSALRTHQSNRHIIKFTRSRMSDHAPDFAVFIVLRQWPGLLLPLLLQRMSGRVQMQTPEPELFLQYAQTSEQQRSSKMT